jgi:hypothetical protein
MATKAELAEMEELFKFYLAVGEKALAASVAKTIAKIEKKGLK